MRVLFIGDIIGRPGRQAVEKHLQNIKKKYSIDYVIANAENAAGGFGITQEISAGLFMIGCDGLTLGNHIYDQVDAETLLEVNPLVARPANLPPGNPGRQWIMVDGAAAAWCISAMPRAPSSPPRGSMFPRRR